MKSTSNWSHYVIWRTIVTIEHDKHNCKADEYELLISSLFIRKQCVIFFVKYLLLFICTKNSFSYSMKIYLYAMTSICYLRKYTDIQQNIFVFKKKYLYSMKNIWYLRKYICIRKKYFHSMKKYLYSIKNMLYI